RRVSGFLGFAPLGLARRYSAPPPFPPNHDQGRYGGSEDHRAARTECMKRARREPPRGIPKGAQNGEDYDYDSHRVCASCAPYRKYSCCLSSASLDRSAAASSARAMRSSKAACFSPYSPNFAYLFWRASWSSARVRAASANGSLSWRS